MEVKYDFDTVIDRRGTDSLKYDSLESRYGDADLLSLWVADMDFATPDFIIEALQRRLGHPVLGYSIVPEDYWPSVIDWIETRHDYRVEPEWLSYIPGIVKGIGFVIDLFTKPGDKVIIQPPVYHPFRIVTESMGRTVVNNPLIEDNGTYRMDFEQLESVIDGCKLLILSNPHNPAGVVWSKEDLQRLAKLCHEHGVIVVSDEIHSDMPLFGADHHVFTSVSKEAEEIGIVFGAPTKTFNMAGVVSSYSIVPNTELREKFYSWLEASELCDPNMFAPIATTAAFRQGNPWRQQMLEYVEENVRFVEDYCREHIPQIKPWRPQASFLVWLDCRALGLNHRELNDLFVKEARLALNDGEMFGKEGAGFMRLNIGCPRATLRLALNRLKEAVNNISH
ncbi:MAG: PatB family C-S lyase [Bacteroidales bacterium]|nr:PatB family C-S lyase [Bacteroidales bacterium]